ncbi:Calcium-transporting ATPase [Fusarium sp. LHS14.1]|nr:Calcium-transporting ATPase [Fusarium sp. LHS14.1]
MAEGESSDPPMRRRAPLDRSPTFTIDTTNLNTSSTFPKMASDAQLRPALQSNLAVSPQDNARQAGSPRPDLSTAASSESRDSRPISSHNVSSPVTSRSGDRGAAFLAVPETLPSRQKPVDSEDMFSSFSSHGETTVVGSNSMSTQADKYKASDLSSLKAMNDERALKADVGTEADFEVENNPFTFTPGQLNKMFNPKSLAAFYKMGGLNGIEKGLRSDRKAGLSNDETHLDGRVTSEEATTRNYKLETWVVSSAASPTSSHHGDNRFVDRLRVFRDNRLPQMKGKTLLQLMWITYNDKVLILLSIAAVISLAVGLYQTFGGEQKEGGPKVEWIEGVAIIVAIAIVVIVGSLNDYQKERQFARLNKKKQDRDVKVIRSGKTVELSVFDILAGDVVHLEPGDLVPVDGILIEGFNIKCDESQTTGESDIIRKQPADDSGSRIMEGVGTFMCTSTGINSSHGKTLMALNEDPEMTPLQMKLNVIATHIAKLGAVAGLLLFIALFIEFLVRLPHQPDDVSPAEKGQMFLNIFIVVVTIIVVAVPEGLPLAVTLALAFATTRMLRDANLVRHLKACEVMGNATTICSDKTGTLTQNKMQVVSASVGTSHQFGGARPGSPASDGESTPIDTSGDISAADLIAINSTAFEGEVDGQKTFIGSKAETALLMFARAHLGMGPVSEERENAKTIQLIPFDSGRKCMGIVCGLPNGGARLYIKGASEIILAKCSQILRNPSSDGSLAPMSQDNIGTINQLIENYAKRSLLCSGVNLIMDTLAALSLATDPPHDSVLDRKPEPKGSSIISPTMWKMILGQSVYQLAITFLLYYGNPKGILPLPDNKIPSEDEIATLVFNTFVWMQIFNQWNNRRLDNKFNIFEGLTKNLFFISISFIMCGGQVLIIFVGGPAFQVADDGQSGTLWAIAVVLGFISIPFGILIRLIPDQVMLALIPQFLKNRASKVPGLAVSDEEMEKYPEPLTDLRDELNFLRRMKGGRLNNLKFTIQHPKETLMSRSRSPSHPRSHSRSRSRSNSLNIPQTPVQQDDGVMSPAATPNFQMRPRSNQSRSDSALGAPTVMAGVVAAGVGAGWQHMTRPTHEGQTEGDNQDNGTQDSAAHK